MEKILDWRGTKELFHKNMVFTLPIAPAINQFPSNPKTLILEQCKSIKHLNQIHSHLIKTRLIHDLAIANYLLQSAAMVLPESMDYALSVFHNLNNPNSQSFNLVIRGFILKNLPHEAILFFSKIQESSVQPDEFIFSCILKACSRLRALDEGKQIHTHVVKSGLESSMYVKNSLIRMYAGGGDVGVARMLFDGMSERTSFTWNSMFAGYCKSGCWEEVIELFNYMLELDAEFDEFTLVSVLSACGRLGDLELGKWVRDYIVAKGLKDNATLMTSLVDMFAKCGLVDTARSLFDQMSQRDVVAWSAMISGYSQARRCKEALSLFHEMQKANVMPNEVTMVSVLSSCAELGALETGKWVHSHMEKMKLKLTIPLGTALLDFYAKCGLIDCSVEIFQKMPRKNALTWTAFIQGLASNGQGNRALHFFRSMIVKNIEPTGVTFLGILSGCSHGGLVDEGRDLFTLMSRDFGIEPRIEHYGCMVDLLARAGLIEEAYQFIVNMPMKPHAVIWRTLLASCKIHKNVRIGEKSFKHIVEMGSTNSGDYVLLSNIYAYAGRWSDAARVRREMKEKGIKKIPGCSMIEVDGVIHEFFAEDNAHPQSNEIYAATEKMIARIKLAGYVLDMTEARLDAAEDDKKASVSHHSEKLAIAFGLISTSDGTPIRISKNLRVCTDCHNATKMISKVFHREIIVRDRNRFHHFKDGLCSCNDYW